MRHLIIFCFLALSCLQANSKVNKIKISADQPGAQIPSTMYGIFFEDINYGADGGLYAEKIKNRSFDFPTPLEGWTSFGDVTVMNDGPFENNPNYVRLSAPNHVEKYTGIDNEGFFGVSFEKGKQYRLSFWGRVPDGKTSSLRLCLIDPASNNESQICASDTVVVKGNEWAKYTTVLTPEYTVIKGKLRIFLCKPENAVDMEHISLFPVDTWQGHENGLRKDLVQKLYDLKPGVLRFPGGCIVEGTDLETRYQWKNTIGPVENRPLNENRWHYTFNYRFFPDYFQSNGLGYFEYMQLCEEIGAQAVPVMNVGMACQFQNEEDENKVPVDSLQPYIDDVIDFIEFCNGPADSEWGRKRAEMGHEAPFGLQFIAIGNEQWGPEYVERLKPFVKAVREKYPDIKIIGSTGPWSGGEDFEYLSKAMPECDVDLVDEHYYAPEGWFLRNAGRYDSYDRNGPKIYAGEYACHGSNGKKFNHFNASLMEAAYMTGLERNADIVEMATYAPLFAHVEGWQWRPDMIWFDNLESVPTASYYVQQLYSLNKGSHVVPVTLDGKPLIGGENQNGLYASAVTEDPSGDLIVKIANTSAEPQPIEFELKGKKAGKDYSEVLVTALHSDDPDADNNLENPINVVPVSNVLPLLEKDNFTTELPAKTFAVYRFKKSGK